MGCNDVCTSKISVWWDIENCPVPRNVDPHLIAQNVSSAVHNANFRGPVTIDVFGDTKHLEQRTLEALSSTGVSINHIPSGNKDAADKAILVAMLFWALDNPPPAHFLLISGDGDFANALHRLRMKRYNVLLARPDQPIKPALLGAATSVWYWTSVAKGQLSSLEHLEKEGHASRTSLDISSKKAAFSHSGLQDIGLDTTLCKRSNGNSAMALQSTTLRSLCPQGGQAKLVVNSSTMFSSSQQQVTVEPIKGHSHNGGKSSGHVDLKSFFPDETDPEEVDMLVSKGDANSSADCDVAGHSPLSEQTFTGLQRGSNSSVPVKLRHCSSDNMMPNLCGIVKPGSPQDAYPCPSIPPHADDKFVCMPGPKKPLNKVMKALKTLEQGKLLPTELNLIECMCFWDKNLNKADAHQIISTAVHVGEIASLRGGSGYFGIFLPLGTKLWECVNVDDMLYNYPEDLWEDFLHFLCSRSDTCRAFLESKSMYEAAYILKDKGPRKCQPLLAGQVYRLLCQSIKRKEWLRVHGPQWPCLRINNEAVKGLANGSYHNSLVTKPITKSSKLEALCHIPSSHEESKPGVSFSLSSKLAKLRAWLIGTAKTKSMENYDISQVPKDFEYATGIHLDYTEFGFTRFSELLEYFSDIVCIKEARKGLLVLRPVRKVYSKPALSCKSGVDEKIAQVAISGKVSRMPIAAANKKVILDKLKKWLVQSPNLKWGYDISRLKVEFEQETGIILDYESLGYTKFKDMVCDLSDFVRVETPSLGVCVVFLKDKGPHLPRLPVAPPLLSP